ncbi:MULTISPECIES: hypothetical protein [Lysobacter]|uniref:Transmembrane protein n=1 Tax=Lysobacter gummosus TaxID=262324 RepID=A0ABY3XEB3_9GAMM|nr:MULTISPECIES: hypothetical protein [Lysobacter]UJB20020.1 hypothetical protein L1A79_02695 [Lysobacter capsici]UJQ30865.1 hypothetical protein L2D09_12165 [Lysobacter gummosus]UNP28733.1 hypothetical protein MOV92_19965 [Lysobacter gummosus]
MKTRHVFSTPDLATAQAAMDAAREAGVHDNDILLIARADIELESIPNDRREADTDLMPAAVRGAGYGGAAGLLAGLLAVVIAPIGLTIAGAAAATVAGAMVGCWASALVGSSLPDPIRRKFDAHIQAGRILVVIDGDREVLTQAEARMLANTVGAEVLPFDSLAAFA